MTKVIVSDNGGTAVLSDFDIEVDDVNVAWSIPNSTTGRHQEGQNFGWHLQARRGERRQLHRG